LHFPRVAYRVPTYRSFLPLSQGRSTKAQINAPHTRIKELEISKRRQCFSVDPLCPYRRLISAPHLPPRTGLCSCSARVVSMNPLCRCVEPPRATHRGVSCPGAWVMLVFRLRYRKKTKTFAKKNYQPPASRSDGRHLVCPLNVFYEGVFTLQAYICRIRMSCAALNPPRPSGQGRPSHTRAASHRVRAPALSTPRSELILPDADDADQESPRSASPHGQTHRRRLLGLASTMSSIFS